MLHVLANHWWLVLLRGTAAIVFAVLAFAWPGASLVALVILYGAYALTDGVFALGAAMAGKGAVPRWWLVLVGVAGLAAGLAAFFWPGVTALVLVWIIGAWAVAHGILEIAGAIQLRREIDNEWLLGLGGALSVLFGLFVLVRPGAGALALLFVIAAYTLAFGIVTVALAFKLRRHRVVAERAHALQRTSSTAR